MHNIDLPFVFEDGLVELGKESFQSIIIPVVLNVILGCIQKRILQRQGLHMVLCTKAQCPKTNEYKEPLHHGCTPVPWLIL